MINRGHYHYLISFCVKQWITKAKPRTIPGVKVNISSRITQPWRSFTQLIIDSDHSLQANVYPSTSCSRRFFKASMTKRSLCGNPYQLPTLESGHCVPNDSLLHPILRNLYHDGLLFHQNYSSYCIILLGYVYNKQLAKIVVFVVLPKGSL